MDDLAWHQKNEMLGTDRPMHHSRSARHNMAPTASMGPWDERDGMGYVCMYLCVHMDEPVEKLENWGVQ